MASKYHELSWSEKMLNKDDLMYMRRAIDLARQGENSGGGPIGCVIVLDGQVIGKGYNSVDKRHDPTAHAEIVSMRRAGEFLNRSRFEGATLYSTLQPCGMCSMASIWAGISRIVYGAEREQVHQMYFEDRHFQTIDFIRDAFKDDLTVTGSVLGDECAKLYYRPWDNPPDDKQANK
jgi:tRNA(adenine34) deaminase